MIEKKYLDAYENAIKKVERTSLRIKSTFPHTASLETGEYSSETPWFWTGGFWGGILQLAYRETKDIRFLSLLSEIEQKQDANLSEFFMRMHHDVGFLFMPTSVESYRLTKNEFSLRRGYMAATILASRFNEKGKFIRAWNGDKRVGYVIIDCMMNLSILYWASKQFNDPRFYHIAKAHADTVLKTYVRPDYTVPHIVEFDPNTGEMLRCHGGQGKADDSVWARGQAWAIYGFAISYRETKDPAYLEASTKIGKKFVDSLPPEGIPYYDFKADETDNNVFDSSAASIAASGLMECYQLTGDIEYLERAKKLLDALIDRYADFSDKSEGIIQMGTVNKPADVGINVPIIYGDYFFMEALLKMKGEKGIF